MVLLVAPIIPVGAIPFLADVQNLSPPQNMANFLL